MPAAEGAVVPAAPVDAGVSAGTAPPRAPRHRDRRIDALKGFAIVCVVAYHAAGQYFSYSPTTGVVYYPWAVDFRALLFSFMLPLFTFMSGYVLGRVGGFRPRDYFWKRTLGLLVPYVAWETIYGPGRDKHPEMLLSVGNFFSYYAHIFIDPRWEGRMWYLYALWIVLTFLGVARLLGDRTWVLLLSVPLVWVIATYGEFNWIRWMYIYVVLGVLWRRYEPAIKPHLTAIGIAGALLYVPLRVGAERAGILLEHLPKVLDSAQSVVLTFLPIAGGACAVAALLAGSYHIGGAFESWLAVLGRLSLGIYVVHFPFVEMWRGMPAWFLPINVAVALVLASGITLALGRWRVTALLLLGEPWTRKPRPLGDVRTETL